MTSLIAMVATITRIGDTPLIHAGMNDRMNTPDLVNINGPSIVRMPGWAAGRRGRYHMYFAHHKGHYIRMAYADQLAGPWTVYDPGVLDRRDSLFEAENPQPDPNLPVPYWADDLGDYLYAHVASPDVHIDAATQQIHMYFHGLLRDGTQLTRYATSADGLHFTPQEPLLGGPYFRLFRWDGLFYAIDWEGQFYRAETWAGPFTMLDWRVPDDIALNQRDDDGVLHRLRHPHVFVDRDDRMHLTFTRMGDRPEAIYHAEITPTPRRTSNNHPGRANHNHPGRASRNHPISEAPWQFGPASLWLRSAPGWEGGDLPMAASMMGTAIERVHELRDPMLFRDGDTLYLAYCGGGESGIGLATVAGL